MSAVENGADRPEPGQPSARKARQRVAPSSEPVASDAPVVQDASEAEVPPAPPIADALLEQRFRENLRQAVTYSMYRWSLDRDDAEDVAQSAFLRMVEQCREAPALLADQVQFAAYLFTTIRTTAINAAAKATEDQLDQPPEEVVEDEDRPGYWHNNPEADLDYKTTELRLFRALVRIRRNLRLTLLLRRVFDVRVGEVAWRLGISERAVSERVRKATALLRAMLPDLAHGRRHRKNSDYAEIDS